MSNFSKNILIYIFGILFGLINFVFFFQLNIPIDILFYKGMFIALLTIVIQFFTISYLIKIKKYIINKLHVLIICLSTFLIIFVLHVVVLTAVDRAISVFFLGHMSNSVKALSKDEIENFFVKKYVIEYGAIERRIEEQIKSGNLEEKNNKYSLTERGIFTHRILLNLSKLFNIDAKFIDPS